MKKYQEKRKKGETIPEALVSVLIIAISLCMVALALLMGKDVSEKSQHTFNDFYQNENVLVSSIYSDEGDPSLELSTMRINIRSDKSIMNQTINTYIHFSPELQLFTITR